MLKIDIHTGCFEDVGTRKEAESSVGRNIYYCYKIYSVVQESFLLLIEVKEEIYEVSTFYHSKY